MVHLPALVLPADFIRFLKTPGAGAGLSDLLRRTPGLYLVMERAFEEFNEHRIGLEKIASTLGWANFRDRMASVYIYKALHGVFPDQTDMELVADATGLEARFSERSITASSRVFLLGFYLKFLNIYLSLREDTSPVALPSEVDELMTLSPVKSERTDWLLLMVWHLEAFLGASFVRERILAGSSWQELHGMLDKKQQFHLLSNLLSYGASIQEDELFLFERI